MWPPLIRLRAITVPMFPRPTKPTLIWAIPRLSSVRGDSRAALCMLRLLPPSKFGENPAAGKRKLGLYAIEIVKQQFAVTFAPLACDHHRVNVCQVGLHDNRGHRIVDR